jgi:hypothetical protein
MPARPAKCFTGQLHDNALPGLHLLRKALVGGGLHAADLPLPGNCRTAHIAFQEKLLAL